MTGARVRNVKRKKARGSEREKKSDELLLWSVVLFEFVFFYFLYFCSVCGVTRECESECLSVFISTWGGVTEASLSLRKTTTMCSHHFWPTTRVCMTPGSLAGLLLVILLFFWTSISIKNTGLPDLFETIKDIKVDIVIIILCQCLH